MSSNNSSLADQFWKGLGNAVTDVREKVEEATWGRQVTGQEQQPESAGEQERAGFGSWTTHKEVYPGREQTGRTGAGLDGEVMGPEQDTKTYKPSDFRAIEHGTVIDAEPQRRSNHEALKDWGYPRPEDCQNNEHGHNQKQEQERGVSR